MTIWHFSTTRLTRHAEVGRAGVGTLVACMIVIAVLVTGFVSTHSHTGKWIWVGVAIWAIIAGVALFFIRGAGSSEHD